MKKLLNILPLMMLLLMLVSVHAADAQIKIKRPKIDLNKTGDKVMDKIFGKEEEEKNQEVMEESGGQDQNGTAKGKKLTPPDVNTHLNNAEASLSAAQYSAVRFELRQAMLGVELEIGYKVLEMLPETVDGIAFNPDEDQVVSSGIGFVGLVINRDYEGKSKNVSASIVNNAALMGFYSGILTSGNYSSSEGEYKAINVQGYRGVITFDGGNEYQLAVPLGQQTLFQLTCDGFGDEQAVMQTASSYSLQGIAELLGEQ